MRAEMFFRNPTSKQEFLPRMHTDKHGFGFFIRANPCKAMINALPFPAAAP
jgi:hypothetical protein